MIKSEVKEKYKDIIWEKSSYKTTLWQTRGAILFLEMFGKYSISSQELIDALE